MSTVIATRREKNSEARREQVLNAAAASFVRHGFHGASMTVVAKSAEMSIGHIYHYFENKDAIIVAVVERELSMTRERLQPLFEVPTEQFLDVLIERAGEIVDSLTDPFHSALHLEILAESERNDAIASVVHAKDREARAIWSDLFRSKYGCDDCGGEVEMIMGLYNALAVRAVRNPDLDVHALIPMINRVLRTVIETVQEKGKG